MPKYVCRDTEGNEIPAEGISHFEAVKTIVSKDLVVVPADSSSDATIEVIGKSVTKYFKTKPRRGRGVAKPKEGSTPKVKKSAGRETLIIVPFPECDVDDIITEYRGYYVKAPLDQVYEVVSQYIQEKDLGECYFKRQGCFEDYVTDFIPLSLQSGYAFLVDVPAGKHEDGVFVVIERDRDERNAYTIEGLCVLLEGIASNELLKAVNFDPKGNYDRDKLLDSLLDLADGIFIDGYKCKVRGLRCLVYDDWFDAMATISLDEATKCITKSIESNDWAHECLDHYYCSDFLY